MATFKGDKQQNTMFGSTLVSQEQEFIATLDSPKLDSAYPIHNSAV